MHRTGGGARVGRCRNAARLRPCTRARRPPRKAHLSLGLRLEKGAEEDGTGEELVHDLRARAQRWVWMGLTGGVP